MANQLIFQKRTLYKLRQSYGVKVDLYKVPDGNTTDFTTGTKSVTRTRFADVQCIRLPKRGSRAVGNYSGINNPFKYGGTYDLNARNFIFETSKITFVPEEGSDYIITGMEKFNIKKVHELDYGYLCSCEAIESSQLMQVFNINVTTTLVQTQTLSGVVE